MLSKKKDREVWADAIPDPSLRRVRFKIRFGLPGPTIAGTASQSGAMCLVCRNPVPLSYVRDEGRAGRMSAQLLAVVKQADRRRIYVTPTERDEILAQVEPPLSPPETSLPDKALGFRVQAYGMVRHADLFSSRQLAVLCKLSDLVSEVYARVIDDSGGDVEYSRAIATYLAFAIDKYSEYGCSLAPWYSKEDRPKGLFSGQRLPMVWDYSEVNPFGDIGGSLHRSVDIVADAISGVSTSGKLADVCQADASTICIGNAIVSTDPPYYDNVGYADLSDFFYIWLRRSLQHLYPELMATVLVPKVEELVAEPFRHGGRDAAEHHFEAGFLNVFSRLAKDHRIDTPQTIYYAFKQSEDDGDGAKAVASTGWETLLSGMVESGLMITGTWPVRGERAGRMRDVGSNALASCIVLVCRRRSVTAPITDRRGFLTKLRVRLATDLRMLQSGGIAPVDLAQAAIGPGMAVFSSFTKVVEPSGEPMSVRTALALINQVLDEVSAEQEGEFDQDTRWAVSWYSEYGHEDGPYGRADDLARAKNVSVDGLVRAGIVRSGAGKVRLLVREDLASDWDPSTDDRVTVWEVCQHLIRRLDDGATSAGELLARVGGLGDAARDLAYRLFQIAESKKWAKEAGPYNALAAEWPELTRVAAAPAAGQGTLL